MKFWRILVRVERPNTLREVLGSMLTMAVSLELTLNWRGSPFFSGALIVITLCSESMSVHCARARADELEKRLDEKLNKACKDAELKKQHEIKKVFSEGKAEILVEEKPRIFNLNESTTYSTPYLDKIKIKVRNLFIEKPLSNDGTQLFEDYLAEVLNRVDHGGFSMDVPIIDILESLFRFSQNILTHAKVYSQESGKIEKDHLNDAIIYLDSRGILGLTTTNVVNEISRARQFRH